MKPVDFVKIIVNQYNNYQGVFKNHLNAEDYVPKTSDKKKALFLFYVVQLDYATKSQRLYQGAKELFNHQPNFYSPSFILSLSRKELKDFLSTYLKPRYINEAIERYQINSRMLSKEYNQNPLLIFKQSVTTQEILNKIRKFRGFGPKIGNFFVRTIINTYSFNYPDIEIILPPVDIHDVKIAYLMGYINSPKMTTQNINQTKKVWSQACHQAGVSWLVFDKALWLFGSEAKPKSKEEILDLL